MKKLWLLWALAWWSNFLYAQHAPQVDYQLEISKKIYSLASSNLSATPLLNVLYLELADSAIDHQKWMDARNALANVQEELLTTNEQDKYNYKWAYVSAAQGKFQAALESLQKIEKQNFQSEQLSCISACMILDTAYLFSHAKNLNSLIPDTTISNWKASFPKEKNSSTAVWLSAVLPGAGSAYAHNLKHAFTALIGCSITALGSIYLMKHDYYIIPLVAGVGLFTRFYAGSLKNAKLDTANWNEQQIKSWQQIVCKKLLEKPIEPNLN